ncbi:porin [Comamonas thiooxydans]|uniref:porin n=1 Tax=Comamonas thiooxydans TaxID=363952 RepID=UPI000A2D5201|nr:porin [Comamonas thiooxydans]BDR09183.1 porin [Comamonas thiooxydans]
MKKIALLPLAAALCVAYTSAHAQSSVTMYGLVDTAVEHLSNTPTGSLTRMPNLSGSLPSRLGFRGAEDLGNGIRAIFTLEMGFGVDSGTLNQGGRGFGRQSFVGVAGPWGTVTLGRQYTMLYWSMLDSDLLGPNLFGSGSLDSYFPNARVDNSIAYRGKFGGFDVGATYSLGRDTVNAGPSPSGTNCAGESSTDKSACRAWSAMVKYDTESWGVAGSIDEFKGGAGAFAGLTSSSKTDRRAMINGWAKIAGAKLGVGLVDRHNDGSAATPRSKLWWVGVGYPITPQLNVEAQYFKLDYRNSANQANLWAVRGTYALSKRTAVYATAGRISNDGSLALSVSGAAAGGAPAAGAGQTGIGAGIRHSF